MKNLKAIIMIILLGLVGCSNDGLGGLFSNKKELIIIPREDTIKALVTVEDARFSIDIPEGWVIETTGEYATFGFRAYDPDNPKRSIFYYGKMSPFIKSEEAKEFWAWYASTGYQNSKLYADAPVLYDTSIEGLYYTFNVFTEFARTYGINHNFPDFSKLEILEQYSTPTEMSNNAIDESTLRLRIDDNGYPIDAMVTATLVDALYYPANGIDVGFYTAYRVSGIMAPADDFMHHEDRLAESLSSFRYKDEYIQEGVKLIEWETEQAKLLQKTLNQTTKLINDAWAYRNKVNDKANAQFISYLRGKAYLQDPQSGQIYEGDQATIDDYLNNPKDYKDPNLIPIDQNSPQFGQPISGVIKP